MKCSRCEIDLGIVEDYAVCQNCGAICPVVTFVNCTPHDIYEVTTHTLFKRSDSIARCNTVKDQYSMLNDIPMYSVSYGEVTGLPKAKDEVFYIVSMLVKQALPSRSDLVCPGDLVRDVEGKPIGCHGFTWELTK